MRTDLAIYINIFHNSSYILWATTWQCEGLHVDHCMVQVIEVAWTNSMQIYERSESLVSKKTVWSLQWIFRIWRKRSIPVSIQKCTYTSVVSRSVLQKRWYKWHIFIACLVNLTLISFMFWMLQCRFFSVKTDVWTWERIGCIVTDFLG